MTPRGHAIALAAPLAAACLIGCPTGSDDDGGGSAVATQLAVTSQPLGATDGAPLASQPRVELRSASGALVTTATNTVTAALASGAGSLTGTTSVAAVGGVAQFTDLGITGTGTFSLSFTAAGLTPATSLTFSVAARPASTVTMVTQPAGGVSGVALPTQPVVELRDATGARATGSNAPVTVSLASGTGTLAGTVTVAAVNGLATFTDLVVSGGGPFTLSFSAPGLAAATSGSFSVALPASISLGATPLLLNAGGNAPLTPVVRDAAGAVIPNVPLTFATRAAAQATVSGTPAVRESLLAVVADPGGAVLYAAPAGFSVRRDTTLTVSVLVDTRALVPKLASATIAVTWSPTVLAYQSHAAGAQVSPVVNPAGAATGTLLLSFADPTGYSGLVEVLRITFTAGPTVATAGTLALSASEMSAATFASMLPLLVQVTQPVVIR